MICEPFLSSSTVEHAAVNRGVVGSSPTWGAKRKSSAESTAFSFVFSRGLEAALRNRSGGAILAAAKRRCETAQPGGQASRERSEGALPGEPKKSP